MRLFLLFLIVPLIEIALFIQIGGIIGLGWTLLIVILTAILGAMLVRSQGLAVLNELRESLENLRDPVESLAHGAMILFSGALLLTPGFFTDAVGFALLVPRIRAWIITAVRDRVVVREVRYGRPADAPVDPDIIDAEFEEVDRRSGSSGSSGWTRH